MPYNPHEPSPRAASRPLPRALWAAAHNLSVNPPATGTPRAAQHLAHRTPGTVDTTATSIRYYSDQTIPRHTARKSHARPCHIHVSTRFGRTHRSAGAYSTLPAWPNPAQLDSVCPQILLQTTCSHLPPLRTQRTDKRGRPRTTTRHDVPNRRCRLESIGSAHPLPLRGGLRERERDKDDASLLRTRARADVDGSRVGTKPSAPCCRHIFLTVTLQANKQPTATRQLRIPRDY